MKKLKLLILSVVIMSFTMNLLAFGGLGKKQEPEPYKGYEITDKALLKQFEDAMIKRLRKKYQTRKDFDQSKLEEKLEYHRKDIQRSTYYDFSKKNGITDYQIMMKVFMPVKYTSKYYDYVTNNIYIFKNNKIFFMPFDFNKFLKEENIIIDSTNVFKLVKQFIRFNVTGDVYFDDAYFTDEKPNFQTSSKYNIVVKTHGKNGKHKIKWGFRVNFENGNIYNYYLQNMKNKRYSENHLNIACTNKSNKLGSTQILWTNSLDVDSKGISKIDLPDTLYFRDDFLEGYQGSWWNKRRSVIRKKDGTLLEPKIKIQHDYPNFNYKIYHSYDCPPKSLNFNLLDSGTTLNDSYTFTLPDTIVSTGIWKIEIEHGTGNNYTNEDYYFQVFDAITGNFNNQLNGYSDGYRIYYRENDNGTLNPEDVANKIAKKMNNQTNNQHNYSYFV